MFNSPRDRPVSQVTTLRRDNADDQEDGSGPGGRSAPHARRVRRRRGEQLRRQRRRQDGSRASPTRRSTSGSSATTPVRSPRPRPPARSAWRSSSTPSTRPAASADASSSRSRATPSTTPQQTTQAYRSTASKVLMIGEVLGSVSIDAIKTNIERDDMPALAISLNTSTLVEQEHLRPAAGLRGRAGQRPDLGRGEGRCVARTSRSRSASLPAPTSTARPTRAPSKAVAEATPGVEVVVGRRPSRSADKDFTAQVSDLKELRRRDRHAGHRPGPDRRLRRHRGPARLRRRRGSPPPAPGSPRWPSR